MRHMSQIEPRALTPTLSLWGEGGVRGLCGMFIVK